MTELTRLHSAWDVDRHIVLEGEKLVLIRFSHYGEATEQEEDMAHTLSTRQIDEVLVALAPKVRKYCTIYVVSTLEVPEFNVMYELGHSREPFAVMFFYRNAHIRVDVGTGNNNKINFVVSEDELLSIADAAYRAGRSGKTIAYSEKKFTTAAVRR
ncbi:spliceosomal U5 snRNP-specific protein, putative [Trypanosoma equiperdum]|uniref:Spliceosomal U5 snRNP-specific protein, putative n=3 Tax=Trypanozoon TaxID=39700 RepID=Q57XD3_TRYB2|nr:spliceosomal U5 snRNP-specific protein, putative [Trypanosoma brucei brucei TREU927]AAX69726.1 spliceosomal U5 snRNP-specific protein, putative [Trypanosoma brucei]AAZ13023.1 spliceosomal U5 snRNP-specific protein, putative [Trypanosoma brucei brucei TREU927]RHW70738.1 spliceosomal U5 snRNP-specific protein [Trypanosoma brucei equiperdum]SCU72033.1 spliceosomal U5 snRNP-specific protein, putative [Trypanosoma equiperdum]